MRTCSPLLQSCLDKAARIAEQTKQFKAPIGADGKREPKLYSWHEPQVECIAKGKSKTPYEFGTKVSLASTHQGNLIVGARAFPGNPYDGHTLAEQLEQSTVLMQDVELKPKVVFVDLGYRGQDASNPGVQVVHRGKFKSLSGKERQDLKRRQAIEPIIGHLKSDHGLRRNFLKGERGDKLYVILCAAGYNIAWLLREIAKKGVKHAFFGARRGARWWRRSEA
jgi:transposase, IS5 family